MRIFYTSLLPGVFGMLRPIVIGSCVWLIACSTNPSEWEVVINRRVARIEVDASAVRSHEMVFSWIYYPVGDPELLEHERHEIIFETSRGDREVLRAPPTELLIGIKNGHSIDEVVQLLPGIHAQFVTSLLQGRAIHIRVVGPLGWKEAAKIISRWSSVDWVENSYRRAWGPVPAGQYGDFAVAAVGGSGVPGDYRLQVQAGDTVWARYVQPTGEVLSAWTTIPAQ